MRQGYHKGLEDYYIYRQKSKNLLVNASKNHTMKERKWINAKNVARKYQEMERVKKHQ